MLTMTGGRAIIKGMVFDIKKYAVDDGPGIRTTIFFKGCPLRCWWCHNPEGQSSAPELMYRSNRCIGCGTCVESCQKKAISKDDDKICISRKDCDMCGRCADECPTGALMIVGREMSVDEVVEEIDKDLIFYGESEGGVTFSGGEPLLQLDFLNLLLEECKKRNIHTAVDTSGCVQPQALDKISEKVDLFLYDIKIMDDIEHRKYTGVSNRLILRNFKKLTGDGCDILVRLPIIPEINDSADNLTKITDFMLLHNVKSVSLLPYHRAGIEKYRNLSRAYKLEKTQAPSDKNLNSIRRQLETLGLNVKIGGG